MDYTLILAWCLLAFTIILVRYEPRIRHWFIMRRKLDTSDPDICRKILNGTIFDSPLGKNQLTLRESRARPNQRLVRAFGIDNGFTTTEEHWALRFKTEASQRLQKQLDWPYMSDTVKTLLSRRLQEIPKPHGYTSLTALVQTLTLKMVIELVSLHDPREMVDDMMLDIASCINDLWILSKDPEADCTQRKQDLDRALNNAQLDGIKNPRRTALNFLLPSYETLWRVVLRCFLEVNFRSTAEVAWQITLTAYLHDPSDSRFSQTHPRGRGVTMESLVNEALRLYPPTRRIYREILPASEGKSRVVAADIEACHRRKSIWGPDSDRFVPGRWITANDEMRRAFMPFGSQPFVCPAKPEFGPRMIGLLVAALAIYLSATEWTLATEKGNDRVVLDLSDAPLDPGRSAYGDVVLVRK